MQKYSFEITVILMFTTRIDLLNQTNDNKWQFNNDQNPYLKCLKITIEITY